MVARSEATARQRRSQGRALRALRLLYTGLAAQRRSLLGELEGSAAVEVWKHYPETDASDEVHGYLWYYHSHGSGGDLHTPEHGHFHVFALERRGGRIVARRHVIAIGMRADGLPCRLFTVNGWVTGESPRSARWSAERMANMKLETGHPVIDRFLVSMCRLYSPVIRRLLRAADLRLSRISSKRQRACADRGFEVLSGCEIDLDAPPVAVR